MAILLFTVFTKMRNYSEKENMSKNSVGISGSKPGNVEAIENANFEALRNPTPTFFNVIFLTAHL